MILVLITLQSKRERSLFLNARKVVGDENAMQRSKALKKGFY